MCIYIYIYIHIYICAGSLQHGAERREAAKATDSLVRAADLITARSCTKTSAVAWLNRPRLDFGL